MSLIIIVGAFTLFAICRIYGGLHHKTSVNEAKGV